MDRNNNNPNPSRPAPAAAPAPQVRVYHEPIPETIYVQTDSSRFKELVQHLTGQTAAAAAAHPGATVPAPVAEPGPSVATGSMSANTALFRSAFPDRPSGLRIIESGASSLSLGFASTPAQERDIREDAAEEKAIREGRFYMRRARPSGWTREPQLLMLFPLSPFPRHTPKGC
ncbi:VQ motif-containing protein 31-like [Brachypodium distachyon]|uniref:VQ motif-containing protein 31-like n=1 Tax=Brachypodium distachyon TaxID=15368 RepID=UPI00052FF494|nr:VQ motif-containing protein 31-like [Brachypodium distachyon]|eukprot:XP_010239207.1 VQ motif-containing protein 31-like [Brachypodium distachyon]